MQQNSRRLIAAGVLLLGLAWIWYSRGDPSTRPGYLESAPQVGFQAPDFTLQTIMGDRITLIELQGTPVVLNFWASWCPPCRAEMPALQAIYEEYGGKVMVLGVNTSNQDARSDMLSFLEDARLSFPILEDIDGSVQQQYAIISLPTTFFINADGSITEVVVGGPMTEAGLRARIEALMEQIP
jgi:thiol-disulfide isomerase/thioredoxin